MIERVNVLVNSCEYKKFCEIEKELEKYQNRTLTDEETSDYVELFLEFSRLYDLLTFEDESTTILKMY